MPQPESASKIAVSGMSFFMRLVLYERRILSNGLNAGHFIRELSELYDRDQALVWHYRFDIRAGSF